MPQQQYAPPQQVLLPPDQITYEMRLNYFKQPPVPPKKRLYVFAGLLLLGIILFHTLFWTLLFLACLVPIVLRFIKWFKELKRPTMTDQEYDQWIWSHYQEIQGESLRKFRIALEGSDVLSNLKTIRGFVFPREPDANFYGIPSTKRGEDGRSRSSVSRFFMLYMAEHELCMYIRDVNALGVECIKKDSSHYYEMVASISMDSYGFYLSHGEDASKLISSDYFAVTMTSGQKIGMTIVSRDDRTEQTVAELRKLLGAKKYNRGQPANYSGAFPGYPAPGQYSVGYGGLPGGYPPPQYPPTPSPFPGAAANQGMFNTYPATPNPNTNGPFPGAGGAGGSQGMFNAYPAATPYPNTGGPFPGTGGNQNTFNTYPSATPYPNITNPFPANGVGYPAASNPYANSANPFATNTGQGGASEPVGAPPPPPSTRSAGTPPFYPENTGA